MQKIILIKDEEFWELNTLLEQGWKVVQMSACCQSESPDYSRCYVLLEK